MKRFLIFAFIILFGIGELQAAGRDDNALNREKTNETQRVSSASVSNRKTVSRAATDTNQNKISSRSAILPLRSETKNTKSARSTVTKKISRSAVTTRKTPELSVTARAATTTTSAAAETKTGAEYEQCKTSYFDCMDQFCKLKNDDFRRCSCSDRVYDLQEVKTVMQDASEQITTFNENLDTVGMTAEQASSTKNLSAGEAALADDKSSSKALLQAIMNSIKGEDSNVGGKFSDLNSVNLAFDSNNAFGNGDSAQMIAAYNGKKLYSAIYGQCRQAVKSSCNDASLQRAITAYLMSVEQDCNTVQAAIKENQKKMKAAVRESNAMLDLARVEDRQNHNSDDLATCLTNVENSVLSEEVCGANYHKCLDNGEFIDITTGSPIEGVPNFYELAKLLTFNDSVKPSEQKLSKNPNNRIFVQNFENKVKKFAEPALDKCTENADTVWSDYMDKAMLAIYYSQQSKVEEIKKGCFDFVSACYMNGDKTLTAAMAELTGSSSTVLQPDKISLNTAICDEYVTSCDNMFDGNIVKEYIANKEGVDTLTACRAVVKQCFDKFGGSSYENFYYPYSGLFTEGSAPDWFSLYSDANHTEYKSTCAKQLAEIASCSSKSMMEQAFGGFDYVPDFTTSGTTPVQETRHYGLMKTDGTLDYRGLRPTGVATEVYNQIVDILSTQCTNVQGRFLETQYIKSNDYDSTDYCKSKFGDTTSSYYNLIDLYGLANGENICPKDYELSFDTKSWGICSCWENGARRSLNGTSVKCVAQIPTKLATAPSTGLYCSSLTNLDVYKNPAASNWCTQSVISDYNQVCPLVVGVANNSSTKLCTWGTGTGNYLIDVEKIPKGID